MAALFVPPRFNPIDGNGLAMPGARLYFFATGTSTPLDTYTDSGLTTPNTNPVVADANGLFPPIYLLSQTLYKVIFKTSTDVTVWTTDPVEGAPLDTTPAVGLLRSYLAGLNTSNSVSSPNTKIDIAGGACADDTNAVAMLMSAGTIDCGTVGANGLDSGALANNTWYHDYAIAKLDGTKAYLASTSATTPTLPTGYIYKRRLGSFKTNGSAQIIAYVQDGDFFQWKAPVIDLNLSNPGTSQTLRTMSTPLGISALWYGTLGFSNSSATVSGVGVQDPAVTSAPPNMVPSVATAANCVNAANTPPFTVRTNTSSQINSIVSSSSVSVALTITTFGWFDRRGRDA